MMRNSFISIGKSILLICFLMAMFENSSATSYYVDAQKGNDNNTGESPKSPWKTLDKVSKHSFLPGDQINFKAGQIFKGTLIISTSGAEGKPIIYTSFGGKVPAVIDGEGTTLRCIQL